MFSVVEGRALLFSEYLTKYERLKTLRFCNVPPNVRGGNARNTRFDLLYDFMFLIPIYFLLSDSCNNANACTNQCIFSKSNRKSPSSRAVTIQAQAKTRKPRQHFFKVGLP